MLKEHGEAQTATSTEHAESLDRNGHDGGPFSLVDNTPSLDEQALALPASPLHYPTAESTGHTAHNTGPASPIQPVSSNCSPKWMHSDVNLLSTCGTEPGENPENEKSRWSSPLEVGKPIKAASKAETSSPVHLEPLKPSSSPGPRSQWSSSSSANSARSLVLINDDDSEEVRASGLVVDLEDLSESEDDGAEQPISKGLETALTAPDTEENGGLRSGVTDGREEREAAAERGKEDSPDSSETPGLTANGEKAQSVVDSPPEIIPGLGLSDDELIYKNNFSSTDVPVQLDGYESDEEDTTNSLSISFHTKAFEGLPFGPDAPVVSEHLFSRAPLIINQFHMLDWLANRWQIVVVELVSVLAAAYVLQALCPS